MTKGVENYSALIKNRARELGFSACGISTAEYLHDEAENFSKWLKQGCHGSMGYMESNFEMRVDPGKLVDGAKSIISVAYNYFPAVRQLDSEAPVISRYAYGADYHYVVKTKLYKLLEFINQVIGSVTGRVFVDSAPVMEKTWAERSGLGWIGKNSNLILKGMGSFFFLGEIITDLELKPDHRSKNYCGNCRLCVDACPTQAISSSGMLDSRKCISYLTIEYRGELPLKYNDKFNNRVFGCDICQEVCPHNKKAVAHIEPLFEPQKEILEMVASEWYAMERSDFKRIFRNSAVKRAGFNQLKRNLSFLKPINNSS